MGSAHVYNEGICSVKEGIHFYTSDYFGQVVKANDKNEIGGFSSLQPSPVSTLHMTDRNVIHYDTQPSNCSRDTKAKVKDVCFCPKRDEIRWK